MKAIRCVKHCFITVDTQGVKKDVEFPFGKWYKIDKLVANKVQDDVEYIDIYFNDGVHSYVARGINRAVFELCGNEIQDAPPLPPLQPPPPPAPKTLPPPKPVVKPTVPTLVTAKPPTVTSNPSSFKPVNE